MPYDMEKRGEKWVVFNTETKDVKGRHDSKIKARRQITCCAVLSTAGSRPGQKPESRWIMGKNLSAIRAIVRQKLRDEFEASKKFKWEDDELDICIQLILAEISESRPYVVKETLKITEYWNYNSLKIIGMEKLY